MPPKCVEARPGAVIRESRPGFLQEYESPLGTLLVAEVAGSPREMGRQYGALLGDRIRAIADRLVGIFTGAGLPEGLVLALIDGAWKHLASHTPQRYLEEMAAIAEGACAAGFEVSLRDLERITAVTNLDLYKREERLVEFLDPAAIADMDEETRAFLASLLPDTTLSCTMFAVWGSRTEDGKCFALRNLDWISQSGMHEARLLTVYRPEGRNAFVSMGYAGVIGCLAGMNECGISLSEVGTFSVREELDGTPWILMGRQVLEDAASLEDAIEIVEQAKHTIGYNYLVADGDPEHFGTPEYFPCAAAFETNFDCVDTFLADDPKEHAARWVDAAGTEHAYGVPMEEAVLRADLAFGKRTRAFQAADDGPGEPENTGNPWGRDFQGSTYTTCHLPMHDMIAAYETGKEYVFPVRNTQVIAAGAPRKIGLDEALNIAATVAHNTECLGENDWNVMSVVYAATDLEFCVAYESCDAAGQWLNAPDSGYLKFGLRALLGTA